MKLVVSGLGRMGMQVAEKLTRDGHKVIAHNRSPEKTEIAVKFGAAGAYSKPEAVDAFKDNEHVIIWLMLPAAIIEAEMAGWFEALGKRVHNTLIIDGGNSDYRLTERHGETARARGADFVDIGTSGGIMGLDNGFCLMVGGNQGSFDLIEPALATLAQPSGGYHYFGPSGSGHYVKMVHNAIEYGMMESLAEGYRMLREGPYKQLDLAAAGNLWQNGSIITSGLNTLSASALADNPQLEGIDGYVAENGETRWTLETARQLGIELPSIQAAFDVRLASQQGKINFATKLLSAMRGRFGGHSLNKEP